MADNYDPFNWYWIIAGSTTQVYSSGAVAFVAPTNATYTAWLARGNQASKIASQQDLVDLLYAAGVPVPAGAVASDALKDKTFDAVPHAVQVWSFDIDNRVRVLEGQPTRTAAQFRAYVKSLM